jgi:hypothetical protein
MRFLSRSIFFVFLFALIVTVRPAFAGYIDPNTGGMLFQFLAVIFAFLSGIFFFFAAQIRVAFARAKRFWRERIRRSDSKGL